MQTHHWLWRGGLFSFYVFWLISFPMQGPLMPSPVKEGLVYFLLPHTLALFLTAHWLKENHFPFWSRVAVALTAFVTLIFPVSGAYGPLLLSLLGLTGAPVAVRAVGLLKEAKNPHLATVLGLALGNFLVFSVSRLPLIQELQFALIAIALLVTMILPGGAAPQRQDPPEAWGKTLPVIFVFYTVGGLYYGFLLPYYHLAAVLPGGEIFFYILAALLGILLIRKSREFLLVLGIILGVFSFSLLQAPKTPLINLSMFASQSSFALVDIYLIMTLIGWGGRAVIGYGLGVMCLGILSGHLVSIYAASAAGYLVIGGNFMLIVAVLVLYLTGEKSRQPQGEPEGAGEKSDAPTKHETAPLERLSGMREPFQKKISPKEREVLALIFQGKTYREVGEALGISESSVKTYMTRIYEKMGVRNKNELFQKLTESK